MSIILTPEQEKVVHHLLETGRFHNINEVIQTALQLLEKENTSYQEWLDETREKVAIGLRELERGEGVSGEVVMVELRNMIRKAREKKA